MRIMQKFKMRLTSFLLIMTCVMLLLVAIYERNCSNALRATSIYVSDPDVRALLADELKLIRERHILNAIRMDLTQRSKK